MTGLFMNSAFFDKALHAFSYMLLHSVWQGLLLALVTGFALLLARKWAPASRYLIMCSLYGAFVITCLMTFVNGWQLTAVSKATVDATLPTAGNPVYQGFQYWVTQLAAFCSRYNHLIISLWLAVFVFRCWQMIRAVRYMGAIRASQLKSAGEVWNQRLAAMIDQLGIQRAVQLFESGLTRVPVVMGHLKPVIYVPLGMLSGLPADQVEAILLHELAHVKRSDYLVNLLQTIVDAVFFFNPGLLWVSYLIKEEREHCCDDVVLTQTGNKKQFIEALIGFKEQTLQRPSLSLAFPGRKSQLIQRVSRIVYGRNNPFSKIEKGFLALSFLICLFVLVSLGGSQWGTSLANENSQPKQDKVLMIAQRTPELNVQQDSISADLQLKLMAVKEVVKANNEKRRAGSNADRARQQQLLIDKEIAAADEARQRTEAANGMDQTADQPLTAALPANRPTSQEDQQGLSAKKLAQQQRELAAIARKHAEEARVQADAERVKAELMRVEASKQRELADIARVQADKDRVRAQEARAEAELMRAKAEKEREKANEARKVAEAQRFKAEADRHYNEQQRQENQRNSTIQLP
ncbi:M56 family metallopeptidase [Paraflavitalea pollutisoli]|uniref:M56 family metallopeptidase n=1 Tax=Paraflavitalea pollutisoli TaxID=3034143 RepID=UPI0023EC2DB8|nr:M56 family metallopeptidase [Paraflavitalea sp. H1-2-19X]